MENATMSLKHHQNTPKTSSKHLQKKPINQSTLRSANIAGAAAKITNAAKPGNALGWKAAMLAAVCCQASLRSLSSQQSSLFIVAAVLANDC